VRLPCWIASTRLHIGLQLAKIITKITKYILQFSELSSAIQKWTYPCRKGGPFLPQQIMKGIVNRQNGMRVIMWRTLIWYKLNYDQAEGKQEWCFGSLVHTLLLFEMHLWHILKILKKNWNKKLCVDIHILHAYKFVSQKFDLLFVRCKKDNF
jgi:hypothetical protein